MSPHCRHHPYPPLRRRRRRLRHLLLLLLLLFTVIPLFLRLLTLMRPFPSSRIDSPFRPPGHKPSLFPPPLSLNPLSISLSFSFCFFCPFKYICFSLAIFLFSCVYSLLSPFSLLLSSPSALYLPRAIYPSIHPSIYSFAHTYIRILARTLLAPLLLSPFLFPSFLSFSLALFLSCSRAGHLRGNSSS